MAFLLENNVKTAKLNYLDKGKISKEDFEKILNFDRTPTKKFTFWMVKQFVNSGGRITLDQIRNIISEYTAFLVRNLVDTEHRDINKFADFAALETYVNTLNSTPGVKSNAEFEKEKEEEADYEIGVDTPDIVITVPYSHAASRKLGLKYFQIRKNGQQTDVPWCTSYQTNTHFNQYFARQLITFYYILCRGRCAEKITKELGHPAVGLSSKYLMVALVVHKDGKKMEAYDAEDHEFSRTPQFNKFMKIIHEFIPDDAPMKQPDWDEKSEGKKEEPPKK